MLKELLGEQGATGHNFFLLSFILKNSIKTFCHHFAGKKKKKILAWLWIEKN